MERNYYEEENLLNRLSKFAGMALLGLTIAALIIISLKEPIEKLNYVELKATYTGYLVISKNNENDSYKLMLRNPFTQEEKIVEINETIYYNLYNVGDTIK